MEAIQSLETRFEHNLDLSIILKSCKMVFEFLDNFQSMYIWQNKKNTLNLEAVVTVSTIKHDAEREIVTETHKEVDGNLLAEELETLITYFFYKIKPYALFEYLIENNRFTTFSNVFIAFRIYLTMPTAVALRERSLSELKLIKMYLRYSMRYHKRGLTIWQCSP